MFQLNISGKCARTNEEVQGKLNLIDLAGSERLSNTGPNHNMQQQRETVHINKSLRYPSPPRAPWPRARCPLSTQYAGSSLTRRVAAGLPT